MGCGREEQLMGAALLSFPPCLLIPPPRRSGPASFVYVASLASERPGADDFPQAEVLLLLQGWYPWGNGSKGGKDVV